MTGILLFATSLALSKAEPKMARTELVRLLAECSAIVVATPGRGPLSPRIEGIVCQSTPFSLNMALRFAPPLPTSGRETEETFTGVDQRMVLFLHQVKGSWDLIDRHFGWIGLSGRKVPFTRFSVGPDPLKYFSGNDFLLIENDLLLPGNLARGEHGSLSEKALLAWIRKAFSAVHRTKTGVPGKKTEPDAPTI